MSVKGKILRCVTIHTATKTTMPSPQLGSLNSSTSTSTTTTVAVVIIDSRQVSLASRKRSCMSREITQVLIGHVHRSR